MRSVSGGCSRVSVWLVRGFHRPTRTPRLDPHVPQQIELNPFESFVSFFTDLNLCSPTFLKSALLISMIRHCGSMLLWSGYRFNPPRALRRDLSRTAWPRRRDSRRCSGARCAAAATRSARPSWARTRSPWRPSRGGRPSSSGCLRRYVAIGGCLRRCDAAASAAISAPTLLTTDYQA